MTKRKVRKIKNVLPLLNLEYYVHIVVKQKQHNQYIPLGGGSSISIISRFGDYAIDKSMVIDNVLFIYVK